MTHRKHGLMGFFDEVSPVLLIYTPSARLEQDCLFFGTAVSPAATVEMIYCAASHRIRQIPHLPIVQGTSSEAMSG